MTLSFPASLITLALPISTVSSFLATLTLGPDPLGYLIEAGPL